MVKQLCFLFCLLVSIHSFAQSYNYQLKGSYKIDGSQKKPVHFTLEWSEDDGKISGNYGDDTFIKNVKVVGIEKNIGRTILVTFPDERKGVRSLTLLVSDMKANQTAKTFPISVVARDRKGNPVITTETSATFTALSRVAQNQEETTCQEGFGALAGYCGVYAGLLTEERDRRNRCNLLFVDAVRLELREDQTLVLHLGEAGTIVEEPIHVIGRLPANIGTNSIDVLSRTCRPLPGVNASGDSCKRLNLAGTFSMRGSNKHFQGTYTIREEGTNNVCVYGLSMDHQDFGQ